MNTPSAVPTLFVLIVALYGAARMRRRKRSAVDEVNAYYERLRKL